MRQKSVLKKLRASYPQYDKSITFVLIDWDTFGSHAVTTSRKIPRRSTLVLVKGGTEIGRLVAQTSEQKIKALLDNGLK
jgi:thioredoxin 1